MRAARADSFDPMPADETEMEPTRIGSATA